MLSPERTRDQSLRTTLNRPTSALHSTYHFLPSINFSCLHFKLDLSNKYKHHTNVSSSIINCMYWVPEFSVFLSIVDHISEIKIEQPAICTTAASSQRTGPSLRAARSPSTRLHKMGRCLFFGFFLHIRVGAELQKKKSSRGFFAYHCCCSGMFRPITASLVVCCMNKQTTTDTRTPPLCWSYFKSPRHFWTWRGNVYLPFDWGGAPGSHIETDPNQRPVENLRKPTVRGLQLASRTTPKYAKYFTIISTSYYVFLSSDKNRESLLVKRLKACGHPEVKYTECGELNSSATFTLCCRQTYSGGEASSCWVSKHFFSSTLAKSSNTNKQYKYLIILGVYNCRCLGFWRTIHNECTDK